MASKLSVERSFAEAAASRLAAVAVEPRRTAGRPGGRDPVEPALTQLAPRKQPRQSRAQATFDAIISACAQLLAQDGYEGLTTNRISERAGVSIGTLYEYFPNRDSIVAALAAVGCRRLVSRMRQATEEAADLEEFAGMQHLLRAGVEALSAPENALTMLVRQAPFILRLPEFRAARADLDDLCQEIGEIGRDRINLPEPVIDIWLISQMLFSAMLEIACLDTGRADREVRLLELSRLTYRMAMGRDPAPAD